MVFVESDFLENLFEIFRKMRGQVFHRATVEQMPETELPPIDPDLGIGRREIELSETIEKLGKEGFATQNAQLILHEIVYMVLLNKLLRDLNFWPNLGTLKMAWSGLL